MSTYKEGSCRLCLKDITDKGFQLIDDVTRNILDSLLLKLKFHDDIKEVICNACNRKLNAAFVFKSSCLNTNNTIIPHVDSEKMLQLDLKEVYAKENRSERLLDIFCNQKICRLCMQLTKDEIKCFGDEELDAIHKFIPEMDIIIIKDPVVCKPCFDSLHTHKTFLNECLEVDQRIRDISQGSENPTDTYPSDFLIKTETLDKEFEIKELEMSIKTECVEIKSEEDKEESYTLLLHSNNEALVNSDCKDPKEEDHEVYKCETYERVTKKKPLLKKLQLKHEDLLEVRMYKCNECNYKTRFKNNIYKHRVKHADPSEVEMYKCDNCEYKTKYKNAIARHVLQHKDPSQVQMYKCKECDYESRYKRNFIKHQLKHEDPSQVQMYSCNDCEYKTEYKNSIKYHVLLHKNSSEVQMYKCKECHYESRHKRNVIKHQLRHEDHPEVQMYKCNECDYKSRYKNNVYTHQLQHEDSSEVKMYKCNNCNYKSKRKGSLTRHVLLHKDPSQAQL